MNLREIVGGIRLRVIEEVTRSRTAAGGSPEISACRDASVQLRAACEDMQNLGTAVGRMPPGPGTMRARIGAHLVRIVQRMLFWYTPQIVRFNVAATSFADQVCLATEKQLAAIQEMNTRLTEVSGEMHRGGSPHSSVVVESDGNRDAGFDAFVAAFQNRSDRQSVLRELHQMVDRAGPVEGPWLDVGCGDEGSPSQYAVITAIRVLERYPMARSFGLLRDCARRLSPGGLLLVTGADPASVLAGASEFWEDPRSLRPVPAATVIAMIEHLGLCLIEKRNLREWPEEEQLPLAALEPVRELNSRLFAPREYAILARLQIRE